ERSTQPMEKTPVEAAALQLAHRARVAVGQDGLRAIRRGDDLVEALGNRGDRLIPGDASELRRALGTDAFHGPAQPVGVVHPFEIACDFLAQEAACEWMIAVAAQIDRLAVAHRYNHGAGIGTIMR